MMISFEHPYVFFALLFLIPVWIFTFFRLNRFFKLFSISDTTEQTETEYALHHFKNARIIRLVCTSLIWICMVFAYAGISWGTAAVPVQKNTDSVSLVFDISYSMMAPDAPGGLTRLEAAARYADRLLQQLEGNPVSIVIAKGDGVLLVPQTENTEMIQLMLKNLSPGMMSSAGSSLGKGVRAAIRSFPANLSQFCNIWVFTDGDETDGLLTPAITDALKSNIPVSIIGFGSERESEITSGDGKTAVRTALRAQNMKNSAASAMRKAGLRQTENQIVCARYIDASEAGSALKIIRPLRKTVFSNTDIRSSGDGATVVMEMQHVYRRGVFLVLALILFIINTAAGESDIRRFKQKIKQAKINRMVSAGLCVFVLVLFSSCSIKMDGAKQILQSTWAWHQQNYRKAVAGFFEVKENASLKENSLLEQYAVYGLASTYMMQGENEAALMRFKQILPDSPDEIRFASCYNTGIIAHRNGDYSEAAKHFRDALLIDPSSISAKINLEVSLQQYEKKQSDSMEQNSSSAHQTQQKSSSVEDAVFNQIRESEQNQWKNQRQHQSDSSVIDY